MQLVAIQDVRVRIGLADRRIESYIPIAGLGFTGGFVMNGVRSKQALVTYQTPYATPATCLGARVLMEAVEGRILFSNPNWQSGDAAVGTLKDLDGNVMGSATLVDGLLMVNGTASGEEIVLGMAFGDPTKAYVRITRCTNPNTCQYQSATFIYDRDQLNGIVVNAGDGDDYLDFLSFAKALSIPVTLNGGAGNDGIEGNGVAWDEDRNDYVVDTTNVGVVMHGGDGNDTLTSGYGPDVLDGGNGDDMIDVSASDKPIKTFVPSNGNDIVCTWSESGWVDSPMNAPTLQPAPTLAEPVTKSQETNDAPDPTAARQPVATPLTMAPAAPNPVTPFATNSLLISDHELWDT